MQTTSLYLDLFWIVSTGLIVILATLSLIVFYTYQQKLTSYNTEMLTLKGLHEKNLLEAQLEMQEITFQQIAHEIHDNVIHSITLASIQLSRLALPDLTDAVSE